jgi:flagellar biosynthesis/type III secretory pathway M-ring protein FliF/YscJ
MAFLSVAMTLEDSIVLAVKSLFAVLALGAVVWFVVLPVWHMLRRTEDVELVMKPFEPPPEEELQIPTDGLNTGRKLSRDELLEELRADPRRTAMVLQQLLRDKPRPGGKTDPAKKR